ncbi:CaiB/BaiF CoA transferase family protein [Pseudacidovorax intermedius]|uniref:CoA-transferase n=1 Tax=Pseudacidovorax intermedius TaxID=433924 RepID=A0A147GRS0_9BURK|nr:CaiB/BaiF CoA-transferase family protein [Pseudacidovorax intermedius]KTT18939.1 CoA-transferase [Pseudacidovorax intermedius]
MQQALNKPLAGIRVLDLSRILAGPMTGQWLADLGADVIKVERPGKGDESRTYGPPFLRDRDGKPTDTAAFYLACNRGKRSMTIDLGSAEGQDIVRGLAAQSDVLIENFRAGTLARYGLGHEQLRALNPRLVYCSITGFGQDGPYARRPGYDGIFQALGGLMATSGHPEEPMKVGMSIVDVITSLYAVMAIQAALRQRDQATGLGQHVDMALLDCTVATLSHYAMSYLTTGEAPLRRGNGGYGGVPSQAFRCKDRSIFLVAANNAQFGRLCEAIGLPQLPGDPRFDSTSRRIANRAVLVDLLAATLAQMESTDVLARLELADVPASPVNELPEVFADPQVRHRGMLQQVDHPLGGSMYLVANPLRMSCSAVGASRPPPLVGEHTREILKELAGMDDVHIDALMAQGVV